MKILDLRLKAAPLPFFGRWRGLLLFFLLFPTALFSQEKFFTGFETAQAGQAFVISEWEKAGFTTDNWDNGMETRAIADTSQAASGKKSLRVTYPVGFSGPAGNGAQVSLVLPDKKEYYMSYKLMFSPDFSFRLGGKLPGLAAGKLCSGGQVCDGTNGFTARFMWRPNGKAVLYLYHMDKKGKWGDDFPLVYPSGEQVVFEPGKWYQLSERVKINSVSDAHDGEVEVWVNGEPVLLEKGFRFTNNGEGVNRFYFSTFHGGSGPDWAPLKTSYIWYDDLTISTQRISK